MADSMTGRERWLAVLNREKPDRVPMDYWATEEATQRLLTHLGCDYDEMTKRYPTWVSHQAWLMFNLNTESLVRE